MNQSKHMPDDSLPDDSILAAGDNKNNSMLFKLAATGHMLHPAIRSDCSDIPIVRPAAYL